MDERVLTEMVKNGDDTPYANHGEHSAKADAQKGVAVEKPDQAGERNAAKVKAVLAEADSFETIDALPSDDDINASSDIDFSKDKVNEVAIGKKGGETAGYVVTVTDSDGYGGDIKFTVGISTDGKVLGVSFLSISETAGLGMRAKQDPSFTSQFTAKSDAVASFSVVTDGSASESNANVDAIGGSTITSKSVTKGVNYALAVYKLVAGN